MTNTNAVAKSNLDTSVMTYTVNGEEIKLSGSIVKNYLVRGSKNITDQELVLFMNLCKHQKLNPFLNEAYIIKFGNNAQIVVGKDAFMKRAESTPEYDGIQAGIIIERNGDMQEIEGTFTQETDKLIGGWAKVYRKDRRVPFYQSVSMEDFDKKQSVWKELPATMIRKVALVQALREAFPDVLGAMYVEEEMPDARDTETRVAETIEEKANTEFIDIQPNEPEPVEVETVEQDDLKKDMRESLEETELVQGELV